MAKDMIDLENLKLPKMSGRTIGLIAVVVILVILGASMIYTVQQDEVAVILRLGKYTRTTQPGLHFKLPLIEQKIPVKIQRQMKQEFGFRTAKSGIRTEYSRENLTAESLMLTGDLNNAIVEWIVQYRIADPYQYLFRVRAVEDTFRYMNEAIMRKVIGDNSVDEVIKLRRQEIAFEAQTMLQEMCKIYETGIKVDKIVLQNVVPPVPVQPYWDEVSKAEQEKEKLRNQAEAERNRVIPRARGEAKKLVKQAEGYKTARVNRAKGESDRFLAVLAEYQKAPAVTKQRLYLETMRDVMPKLGRKLVVDEDVKGLVPLLQLGQEVSK